MEAKKIGDPMLETTEIGPLATAEQIDALEAQVKAAVESGARVVTGGERMVGKGFYYEPTVLVEVRRDSPIYRQELFGPVAMLFRVADIDEAIAVANDTPFGLGASVWTRNRIEQKRFAAALQVGAVFINAPVVSDARLPFGGVKRSGYGRELGSAGMREFLNAKTVVIQEPTAAERAAERIANRVATEPEVDEEEDTYTPSMAIRSRKKAPTERIHIPFLAEERDDRK